MAGCSELDIRLFFRQFLPTGKLTDLYEQQFSLVYNSNGGITYEDVLSMTFLEREWFLERLSDQIKEENRQMKRAQSKGGKSRR